MTYHKVASSNISHLEAHADIYRLLMKGIFNAYVNAYLYIYDQISIKIGQKTASVCNHNQIFIAYDFDTNSNHCLMESLRLCGNLAISFRIR